MFIRITILKGDQPWSQKVSQTLTLLANTLILFAVMGGGVLAAHLLLLAQGKLG